MFKKMMEIIECELNILRLQKEIKRLETQGNSPELFKKRKELLGQLYINFNHPFGFKDMKQLAITELSDQLNKVTKASKSRILKANKTAVVEEEVVTE